MSPVIIAECCQNHNGNREILKKMIHTAAESGADYIKLQTIRSSELTYRERFEKGLFDKSGKPLVIKRPYIEELNRLKKLDLSLDDEQWFVDECLRAGVSSMTTCFSRKGLRDVKELGYEAIKVASYDCPSYPMLRDIRDWWSKIFVSTGACYDDEILKATILLKDTQLTLLHCVTIYPTPISELNLRRMFWLRRFTPFVGFSDHSNVALDGIWASKIALAMGADCIERHYTILDSGSTKDGPVSISPDLLKELRRFADLTRYERMKEIQSGYEDWESALGYATRQMSRNELLNRDYYRGRFSSKISNKEIFNWEDVELYDEPAQDI